MAARGLRIAWSSWYGSDGGPPQHETYDPKPQAPTEFRGPLKAMSTKVPGILVSKLLPNHALLMDKMSIIRSMHHDNGERESGTSGKAGQKRESGTGPILLNWAAPPTSERSSTGRGILISAHPSRATRGTIGRL